MRVLERFEPARYQFELVQGIGMALPEGYALPDLPVVDEDFDAHKLPKCVYPPRVFEIVVEITSTNWQDDVRIKPDVYAERNSGVPHR